MHAKKNLIRFEIRVKDWRFCGEMTAQQVKKMKVFIAKWVQVIAMGFGLFLYGKPTLIEIIEYLYLNNK